MSEEIQKEKIRARILSWTFVGLALIGISTVELSALVGAVALKDALYGGPAKETKTALMDAFGCDQAEGCIIKHNIGGDVVSFLKAVGEVAEGDLVQIHGGCISSCSIFADYARPQVCVTRQAVLVFHKGMIFADRKVKGYFFPAFSKDITLWIYAHGDFPNDVKKEIIMRYPDTLKFWPLCPSQEVAQRGDRLDRKVATAKSK